MFRGMKRGGLLAQIAGVQEHQFIEPPKHPGTVEVTGHFMNDFEKAAFTVKSRIEELIQEKKEARIKEVEGGKQSVIESEILTFKEQLYYVETLMEASIRDRLDLWGKPVGVSHKFKIVLPEISVAIIKVSTSFSEETSEEAASKENEVSGKKCYQASGSSMTTNPAY